MTVILPVNGGNFTYPENGDSNWGINATAWSVAISSATLQKSGGTFTLTAEADFGANFGLKSLYYASRTSNGAAAGQVRLARTDAISYRNAANSADLSLTVDASNQLLWNGENLLSSISTANALVGSNGITVTSGTSSDTIVGFRPEFITASGALQADINAKLSNVVEDTTPQLGGTLDANSQDIVSAGTISGTALAVENGSDSETSIRGPGLNTGIYFSGNNFYLTAGGNEQLEILSNAVVLNTRLRYVTGTSSNPSFNFSGDTGTGLYHKSLSVLGLASGGDERVAVSGIGGGTDGVGITGNLMVTGDVGANSADFISGLTVSGTPVDITGFARTGMLPHQFSFPGSGTLYLCPSASYSHTIVGLNGAQGDTNTINATLFLNGVPVTGISNVTISGTAQDFTATGNNTVSVGSSYYLTFSGSTGMRDYRGTLELERT